MMEFVKCGCGRLRKKFRVKKFLRAKIFGAYWVCGVRVVSQSKFEQV